MGIGPLYSMAKDWAREYYKLPVARPYIITRLENRRTLNHTRRVTRPRKGETSRPQIGTPYREAPAVVHPRPRTTTRPPPTMALYEPDRGFYKLRPGPQCRAERDDREAGVPRVRYGPLPNSALDGSTSWLTATMAREAHPDKDRANDARTSRSSASLHCLTPPRLYGNATPRTAPPLYSMVKDWAREYSKLYMYTSSHGISTSRSSASSH